MKSKEEQQYSLGLDYYRKGNFKEAMKILSELAKNGFFSKGHTGMDFGLGLCYFNGEGVAQDCKRAAELFRALANKGDADAQCSLGYCYEKGSGVVQDGKEALKWYERSANQEYAHGQFCLGNCYYHDYEGLVQDRKRAAELYEQSANQGHMRAQFNLGYCYLNGQGVVKDSKRALELYQQSAEQGDQDAQCSLGKCYEDGQGVVKDLKRALELYQQSANQGNAYAKYNLGRCYEKGHGVLQSWQRAAELYQESANRGNSGGQCSLGFCYEKGYGVLQSWKRAAELYQESANQGNSGGQCNLGFCYEKGYGVPQNWQQALELYQESANQGHSGGQRRLGNCYYHGYGGLVQDRKRAAELYEQSASQGDTDAQFNLGNCYYNGYGVVQNWKRAAELYQEPAKQGHQNAQYNLGYCYSNGHGVVKDLQKAAQLYQQAADQGHTNAQINLELLLQDNPWLLIAPQPVVAAAKPKAAASTVQDMKEDVKKGEEVGAFSIKASFQIDYKELNLGKKLGRGGFGVVYQGTWRGSVVAVKQLLRDLSDEAAQEFKKEVQVMARLRGPNIIALYGYCLGPHSIVMEYMPKGSLFDVLRNGQILDWPVRIKIAEDIASGLAFLHHGQILHRDIKSLNVLLDEHYRAKLTDFGLSEVKKETRTSTATQKFGGTLAWMAPELFARKGKYTDKADVYSLGVTLWELATGKLPFSDAANPGLIPNWVQNGEREDIPKDCHEKLATLIRACWEGEPDKRPESKVAAEFLRSKQDNFLVFLASKQAAFIPNVPVANAKDSDLKNLALNKK